jgi:azobenzene reductase
MKTTILTGSVRKGRQSHKAGLYIARMLRARGVETDLIDLAQTPLPILGTEEAGTPEAMHNIARTGARIAEADALIFVTPEYHGSFSGVLKNALEHFWSEFQKKPAGVVTASSGRMGGINASTQLQHVILSLGAFPLPRLLRRARPSVKQNTITETVSVKTKSQKNEIPQKDKTNWI